jgi:hypothetical protein
MAKNTFIINLKKVRQYKGQLIKKGTLFFLSIKGVFGKQDSKYLGSRNKNQISFYQVSKTVILYQAILFSFFSIAFFLQLYVHWRSQSNVEINNIKQAISSNFERYHETIDLISNKINTHHKEDLLNTAKYNQLLGLQKDYINIDEAYVISIEGNNAVINSMHGKKQFALLPSEGFFSELQSTHQISSYIESNILFVGSFVSNSSYGKEAYILLSVGLEEFTRKVTELVGITGNFSLLSSNLDGNLIPCGTNLFFKYIPQEFNKVLKGNLDIFCSMFLLFCASLLLSLIILRKYFRQLTYYFHNKQSDHKKHIISLTKHLNFLKEYKNKTDIAFALNKGVFNDFLTLYKSDFLEHFNIESSLKGKDVSLAKILFDCKSILYRELLESEVSCEIKISTETNIGYEKSIILSILVINFLHRALYRTPKKGSISVSIDKKKSNTVIRISDTGFDLVPQNRAVEESLFTLSDLSLEELAIKSNIHITKLSKAQSTTIELVLQDKIPTDRRISIKDENIIIFPSSK